MTRLLTAVAAALALAAGAAAHAAAGCTSPGFAVPAGTAQAIRVTAPAPRATTGTLTLWQRSGGCWRRTAGPWPARLGFGGVSAHRREGDGTTPLGTFPLGPVAYGVGPDPGGRLAYHRLVCGDWWDEDVRSPTYNTFRHVACGTKPVFGGGSEALWRSPVGYRHLVVIDYNTSPVVAGLGSGIFLHADVGGPTNGCVTIPLSELVAVMRALDPAARPVISIALA